MTWPRPFQVFSFHIVVARFKLAFSYNFLSSFLAHVRLSCSPPLAFLKPKKKLQLALRARAGHTSTTEKMTTTTLERKQQVFYFAESSIFIQHVFLSKCSTTCTLKSQNSPKFKAFDI